MSARSGELRAWNAEAVVECLGPPGDDLLLADLLRLLEDADREPGLDRLLDEARARVEDDVDRSFSSNWQGRAVFNYDF